MQMRHLLQMEENIKELDSSIDKYLEKFKEAEETLDGIPEKQREKKLIRELKKRGYTVQPLIA